VSIQREPEETVADRVKKIRKSIPPRPGVRSRLGYADVDYFAELVGLPNRQRVMAWEDGAEPLPKYRRRLAALSRGVYRPDDFRTRVSRAELLRRVEALERRV
jgi:hypothetical protein